MLLKITALEQINKWNNNDVYSIRILSLIESYGINYEFAKFYIQLDDNDEIVTLLSCLDSDYTISLTTKSNLDELYQFLQINGYSTVLVNSSFEMNNNYTCGQVMICKDLIPHDFDGFDQYLIDEDFDYIKIYNFSDYDNDFDSFYLDLNHRVRHRTSNILELDVDGEIVALSILSSKYNGYGIITSVKVIEKYRRNGLGSYLVSKLCLLNKNGTYIMRENNKNLEFYNSLGFKNVEEWRLFVNE